MPGDIRFLRSLSERQRQQFRGLWLGCLLLIALVDNSGINARVTTRLYIAAFGPAHVATLDGRVVERNELLPSNRSASHVLMAPVRWCPAQGTCREDVISLDPAYESSIHGSRVAEGDDIPIRAIKSSAVTPMLNGDRSIATIRGARLFAFGLGTLLYSMLGVVVALIVFQVRGFLSRRASND